MEQERLYDSVKGAAMLGALNFGGLLLYVITVAPWLNSAWQEDAQIGLMLLAMWAAIMLTANVYTALTIADERR